MSEKTRKIQVKVDLKGEAAERFLALKRKHGLRFKEKSHVEGIESPQRSHKHSKEVLWFKEKSHVEGIER